MARILVIDDDALVREATKVLLHTRHHEVTLAENGKAGVEAARESDFDLAIVDLFMPDMDGLHVIEAVINAGATYPRATDLIPHRLVRPK